MQGIVCNEIPAVGTAYNKDNWKLYMVHTDTQIRGFFCKYRWLSNFWPSPVWFEGMLYPSVENAYQAAKIIPEYRGILTTCKPNESKKLWKSLPKISESREEWDARKFDVMSGLVFQKFLVHTHLRRILLETGTANLVEANHWGDTYWGYDVNRKAGENNLGKILMNVRKYHQS